MDGVRAELWIGSSDERRNKRIFHKLFAKKDEIESAFGENLDWQELPDKKGCRVCVHFNTYGLTDEAHWDDIISFLADNLAKLIIVFKAPLDAAVKTKTLLPQRRTLILLKWLFDYVCKNSLTSAKNGGNFGGMFLNIIFYNHKKHYAINLFPSGYRKNPQSDEPSGFFLCPLSSHAHENPLTTCQCAVAKCCTYTRYSDKM